MKKLLFLLFLHLPIFLFAQVESVVVQWDETRQQPFFPHALYADGENTLPYLTRKIRWSVEGMVPAARVEVTKTAPLKAPLPEGTPAGHLRPVPVVKVEMVREIGQPYAVISVLPFIRTAAGEVQRVESFTLEL